MLSLSEKRKKVDLIPKPKHSIGICSTCKKYYGCTYPKLSAIVECDEFDGFEYEPAQSKTKMIQRNEVKNNPNLRGLCRTCEKSDTCTFPKKEDGVWHCEEFE